MCGNKAAEQSTLMDEEAARHGSDVKGERRKQEPEEQRIEKEAVMAAQRVEVRRSMRVAEVVVVVAVDEHGTLYKGQNDHGWWRSIDGEDMLARIGMNDKQAAAGGRTWKESMKTSEE